jgi:hypothetical protein
MIDTKIYNGSDINNHTQSATVTRQNRTRGAIGNVVSFFALALMLAAASLTARALPTPTPTPIDMGIVTGGIYSKLSAGEGIILQQPLLDNADEIFSEFRQMGGKWIRIQANWDRNYDPQYTFIADKAHAYGLKVIVVLATGGRKQLYCQPANVTPDIRDPWLDDYVLELNRLATQVFVDRNLLHAQADAYEITNEPNQKNNTAAENHSGCTGVNHYNFRMDGNTLAWLLRFVWNWKILNHRQEKIISGGTINTYTNEPWWNEFFNSYALDPANGERPFDYFAVHPYNPFRSVADYKSLTTAELVAIADRINARTNSYGANATRILVTEYSLKEKPVGEMKTWMTTATETFRDSGVVDAALWYDYRDDAVEHLGLREGYNANLGRYPAKTELWQNFQKLTGVTGYSNDPEYFWQSWRLPNRPPYGFLDYANATGIGGWAYDPDTVLPIPVAIYIDGLHVGTVSANIQRWDLFPAGVAPNAAHGFMMNMPYVSPGCHTVTAIAQNYRGGENVPLPAPKQFCK